MGEAFSPEALIIARESRNETQQNIARATGLQQGLLSRAENGVHPLTDEQVEKVATFLRYPAALFYEPGPLLEGKSGCLYHRKRKTLPAKTLDTINGRMGVRLINTRHMLNGIEMETDRQFHTLDLEEFGTPENIACALRTAWRIPDGPIRDMMALIESAGGLIVMSPFGTHKLFGMSQWTRHGHPLFFLNADTPTDELRWTIAHELGHLTMHGIPTSGDLEQEADAFAGELLAPSRLAMSDLRNLDFRRLPVLKHYWRISMKGLIKRAETIGAINRDKAVRLYKQYSARRWNNAEPFPLTPEQPTLIREVIRVHLEDHRYTIRELASAARLDEAEFRAEFLGPDDDGRPLSLVRA